MCRGQSELGRTKERRHGIAQLVGDDGDEVVTGAHRLAQFLNLLAQRGQLRADVIGRGLSA